MKVNIVINHKAITIRYENHININNEGIKVDRKKIKGWNGQSHKPSRKS
jgi:hypothetical protein